LGAGKSDSTGSKHLLSFRPILASIVCVLIDSRVTGLPKWMRIQGYRKIVEKSAAIREQKPSSPRAGAKRSSSSSNGSSNSSSSNSSSNSNTVSYSESEIFFTAYGKEVLADELVTVGNVPKMCVNMLAVFVLPVSSSIRDQVILELPCIYLLYLYI